MNSLSKSTIQLIGGLPGGKGTGLLRLQSLLQSSLIPDDVKHYLSLPDTLILGNEVFCQFINDNKLQPEKLVGLTDSQILTAFLTSTFPSSFEEAVNIFLHRCHSAVAVRSSGLLEDSKSLPFAGVYNSYMVPVNSEPQINSANVIQAIKAVYASTFFHQARSFMATANIAVHDEMGVVLQQVTGMPHAEYFYPTFSGVMRSVNYYPLDSDVPADGVALLALGLGKYIVDGGLSLRVNPVQPDKVLQTSDTDIALRDTQTSFYALKLQSGLFLPAADDAKNLVRLKVKDADAQNALFGIASTFDFNDQRIYDGLYPGGRKIITFKGLLEHDFFPLPRIMQQVLKAAVSFTHSQVEIEFAGNVDQQGNGGMSLLQMRPIAAASRPIVYDFSKMNRHNALLYSEHVLGNAIIENVRDVVYVKYDADYSTFNNYQTADELEHLNSQLTARKTPYLLIGPGRWGSSDAYLGIPVKWPQISGARVIVELSLLGHHTDDSQGTHFFHNLTSLGVGYFTLYLDSEHTGEWFNKTLLDAMPAVSESAYVRHVRFAHPLRIVMDVMHRKGGVLL